MSVSRGTSPKPDKSSPSDALPLGKSSSNKETSIRDNRPERGSVADFLREAIQPGSSLSFVSAYFTVNAYQHLRDNLESIEELRFLFGEPTFISGIDPEKHSKKEFRLTDSGLALAHSLSQRPIAKACADWIRQKAEVRSIRQSDFLHGKAYHVQNGNKADAILISRSPALDSAPRATTSNSTSSSIPTGNGAICWLGSRKSGRTST